MQVDDGWAATCTCGRHFGRWSDCGFCGSSSGAIVAWLPQATASAGHHSLGVPWRWQGLWLLLCYASCAHHYHATVSTFFAFQFESNAETMLHVYAGLIKLRSIGVEEVRVVGL